MAVARAPSCSQTEMHLQVENGGERREAESTRVESNENRQKMSHERKQSRGDPHIRQR